jgi:uridine nucleosidase
VQLVVFPYQILESDSFLLVSDADLLELKESKGKHAALLSEMCKFYRDWHVKSDGVYGNFTYYFDAASYATMEY